MDINSYVKNKESKILKKCREDVSLGNYCYYFYINGELKYSFGNRDLSKETFTKLWVESLILSKEFLKKSNSEMFCEKVYFDLLGE